MITLQDIKLDFPDWPDDVIEQWLLKFANQPEMGWPPPDPMEDHRWGLLLTHPIAWWRNVTWKLENRDCDFDQLSIDARQTMNKMNEALVDGVDNGYGGDNRLSNWLASEGLVAGELRAKEVEQFQLSRYEAGYRFLLSIRAMQPILGSLRIFLRHRVMSQRVAGRG